jgi:GDP/UDP-N,N'-diacetylbacillosamine 2-epimerase (hydrolysing)
VTGTRAEYGLLKPVMSEIRRAGMNLKIIAAGMHLAPRFGSTYREILRDGFQIAARVPMTPTRDHAEAMGQSVGDGIQRMIRAIRRVDPDVVLVLGDRVEAFAAAVAAAFSRRVVAHIHGGDVTEGGMDEAMRHAITRFAHVHFAATRKSRDRLVRMGEVPKRVFFVGAPGVDAAAAVPRVPRRTLERALDVTFSQPVQVVVQHSVSTSPDSAAREMTETLEAVTASGRQTVVIYPNADAGGRRMISVIERYRRRKNLRIVRNLSAANYLSLLSRAAVLVGNSSSAIIEAPLFGLPAVNIGRRQAGRERSANVVDVPAKRQLIQEATERAVSRFVRAGRAAAFKSPYGDGQASRRIARILRDLRITNDLLQKRITL